MPDQPENTKRVPPEDIEQRGLITDVAVPLGEAFVGGAGFGLAKPVGEALADKIRGPKDPPADK